MTIKLMLNKDEEINRLALDPDVQIRIKHAIVDAIAKRAIKALDSGEISNVINDSLRTILCNDASAWHPTLKPDIVKSVEKAAKNALDAQLLEIFADALPEYQAKFRALMDERLKEIENLDFVAMAQKAVNRFVEIKLLR